ncbi:Asp/Glu/Hydantoin racemase-domain-containing protein [Mycena maculata]|uniref:Asp/Glu/Hydantoin racemase-domain-containing protein n=1 Tax=Mycena maculata TaxID=230809 RepID=A0AAD7KDM0_9AGAR|nr:Asp/Glu/Hydantoin racemase-domain-containing protein [Mycena maculata]
MSSHCKLHISTTPYYTLFFFSSLNLIPASENQHFSAEIYILSAPRSGDPVELPSGVGQFPSARDIILARNQRENSRYGFDCPDLVCSHFATYHRFQPRMPTSILVINPNSSKSVTVGLEEELKTPPETTLAFYTAPANAPPSIDDATTGVLSAAACFHDILRKGLIDQYDGFLVSCFSDHPLVHMLREATPKPTIGILEASIVQALLCGQRFGIVSTGAGYNYSRNREVSTFLGGQSDRFAGMVMSGLGVVELREGDRQHVESKMKESSAELAAAGVDVVILGCAGMAGMQNLVQSGVEEGGFKAVRVADGNKAGVEMLAALVRLAKA